LVLGLDRGGACEGMALRVAAVRAEATRGYLQAREQIYGVYRGVYASIALEGAARREVTALAFVAERAHPNYARLAPTAQAELIRGASGVSGANLDYFVNTLRHLAALGIRERALERLTVLVGPHACRRAGGDRVSACAASRIAALRLRPAPGGRPRGSGHQPFGYRLRLEERG
jgi:cation transport protein ChaC